MKRILGPLLLVLLVVEEKFGKQGFLLGEQVKTRTS
jgi:hypothetical protein